MNPIPKASSALGYLLEVVEPLTWLQVHALFPEVAKPENCSPGPRTATGFGIVESSGDLICWWTLKDTQMAGTIKTWKSSNDPKFEPGRWTWGANL
jgi:hypothetical protein